jgi:glycosyltransferase involved in cell wall biosynthesis
VAEVVGDAGILVPENDPPALAGALSTLLESSTARHDLAARGRARAERFTWDAAAGRFGELLASLP